MSNSIGIDLGGTKIEGVALDSEGAEYGRERIPTESDEGYEHVLGNIEKLYRGMQEKLDHAPHRLGICTPGSTSPRTGKLRNANTECLNGNHLHKDLEERLGRPIGMHNDANCFAAAEALWGAGQGYPVVFGVIMGTGCGGGIVLNGEAHEGHTAIAGEWGHMSIDPQGPKCYCGKRGCVETLISGGGLEARYTEQYGGAVSLKEIIAEYEKGEDPAVSFMAEFFVNFGRSMANLLNVLDPDIVVLGGGVSNFDDIYSRGIEQIETFIFSDYMDTPIVKHQLGDSAGVLGAALIGKEDSGEQAV